MSDLPAHNQIQHAVRLTQGSVTDPVIVRNQGAGMAYQAVAQATAFAVQDATEYLRSVGLIGSTTIAVASARMVETGQSAPWGAIVQEAQQAVDTAAETLRKVGAAAAEILRCFPPDVDTSRS